MTSYLFIFTIARFGVILEPSVGYLTSKVENLGLLITVVSLKQMYKYRLTTPVGKYRKFSHFHLIILKMEQQLCHFGT